MGMFDDLRCEMPLPAPDCDGVSFQTKDFECNLDLYTIRKDGTIWRKCFDGERGQVEGEETQENEHLGRVRFYEFFDMRSKWPGAWLEFEACIIYGKVDKITLIKDERAARSQEGDAK